MSNESYLDFSSESSVKRVKDDQPKYEAISQLPGDNPALLILARSIGTGGIKGAGIKGVRYI